MGDKRHSSLAKIFLTKEKPLNLNNDFNNGFSSIFRVYLIFVSLLERFFLLLNKLGVQRLRVFFQIFYCGGQFVFFVLPLNERKKKKKTSTNTWLLSKPFPP